MSLFQDLIRRKAATPVVQRPSSSGSASDSPHVSATQSRSTTPGANDQNHDGRNKTKQDHTSAEGKGHLFDRVVIGGYSRAQLGNVYAQNVYYSFGPASPYGRREDEPKLSEERLVTGESRSEGMRRLELLEALKFDAMGARLATVNTAHEQTCSWIMDTLEYMRWQNKSLWGEHHGILWIKGNPGAGKSTLMKYALGVAQLQDSAGVLVPYFFNARGQAVERSAEGMYRSLLHELLTRLPHLYSSRSSRSLPYRDSWSVELLESMLRTAVLSLGPGEPVTCYIDALDECEEHEIRDIVAFFEDLGNLVIPRNIQFCLCLSSRHYPHITMDRYEELRLDDQDEHLRDVSKYVKSSLNRLSVPHAIKDDIKSNIESRSAGVFLWVVLVLKFLREAWDNGATHSELIASLRRVPSKLQDLFASILEHADSDTISAFRWVLYSKHELTCKELYFAIRTSAGQLHTGAWDENDVSRDGMRRFILHKTRGLVEVTGYYTRFIHESVREHLLAGGLADLTDQRQHTLEEASGHMMIAQCCMTYIELDTSTYLEHSNKVSSKPAAKKFPLLRYVTKSIYHHWKVAHSGGALRVDQLGDFSAALLCSAARFLEERDRFTLSQRTAEPVTMLCLLIEKDLITLAKDLLTCRAEFESFAALNPGNSKPPHLNFDINARCSGWHGSALGSAAASKDAALMQLLIDHGANANQRGGLFGSPLLIAVGAGSVDCARLLLQHGADVNLTLRDGTNALTKAAFDGSYHMLSMLFDHGAQLTSPGLKSGSLLGARISGRWYWAHSPNWDQGHEDVMGFLLANGVQVNNWSKRSPLWVAAHHHDSDMVRWLSEKGADVDARDHKHWATPLYMVASARPERYRSSNRNDKHQRATVKALLEAGADVNAISSPYGTPLVAAAAEDLRHVVSLLLRQGADLHHRGDFGTAKEVALEKGFDEVVKLLQSHEATETKRIPPLAVANQDNATTAAEADT